MRRRYARRRALALLTLGALVLALALLLREPAPAPQHASVGPGASQDVAAPRPRPAPLVTGAAARHRKVPILMYHVVGAMPAAGPLRELFVRPADFGDQMTALQRAGYQAITLRAAYDAWAHGRPIPHRAVVVSFDDGYRGVYRHAFPVMRRLGWPGTLNLKLDALHEAGGLSPAMIRDLIRAGWEVDSHTVTHADLTTLDVAQLRREIAGSRQRLQREFGVRADFFCYPAGRYDPAVRRVVRRAGYLAATTTNPGYAEPSRLYELKRLRVERTDRVSGLMGELAQR
jgi:peptidoglycan/xylan/chitin deacetylase (PgdA/CDA1 family)